MIVTCDQKWICVHIVYDPMHWSNGSKLCSLLNKNILFKKTDIINKDIIDDIFHLFLKDIYAQCKKGDVDDKEASAVGPSIPTCSYSGSNTVVMQTNLIITGKTQSVHNLNILKTFQNDQNIPKS